jgi:tellurite resistance protein
MREFDRAGPALPQPAARLRHFPISFFAAVMGLAGLAIAWRRAEVLFDPPFAVSGALALAAAGAFALIALAYLAKATAYPAAAAAEWRHPVKLNFFPTISIGLVLLSIALIDRDAAAARALWIAGAALQLAFTLHVMNAWVHRTGLEIGHVNPAWFIPVVGNVLVPIAGVRFLPAELSWFFFSVGIVFWVGLLPIVMQRLFFHAPLPERLSPTLFILVAPPAVGFVAYVALTGTVDAFARMLYYTALLLTLLLARNLFGVVRARFFLSAWAYSFPLAAMTIATALMAERFGTAFFDWLTLVLLAVLTVVVAVLLARTGLAVARRQICVEEN